MWWIFAIQQHESPTGHMCLRILNPTPTSLPTPSLWVVPDHWLCVPCFMHRACPGHLFYIWFQCCSLKSSRSCLLPHSPKVCSLHLCLFCCLAYRNVITIFLNFIYMHSYSVLVYLFLTYFTLYNRLQFRPPHYNQLKCTLFIAV